MTDRKDATDTMKSLAEVLKAVEAIKQAAPISGVVRGEKLTADEKKVLAKDAALASEDEILFVWKEKQQASLADVTASAVVGITAAIVFKLEKGALTKVARRDIVVVRHEKNGWLRWDNLILGCCDKDGKKRVEKMGIYCEDACAYFSGYLASRLCVSGN